MTTHPMKGQTREIVEGPLTGKYFQVIDYVVNQFQGKNIERIKKSHWGLFQPVVRRKYPADDKVVIGKLYPTLEIVCVHDDELNGAEAVDAMPVDLSNVTPIKKAPKKKEKLQ